MLITFAYLQAMSAGLIAGASHDFAEMKMRGFAFARRIEAPAARHAASRLMIDSQCPPRARCLAAAVCAAWLIY